MKNKVGLSYKKFSRMRAGHFLFRFFMVHVGFIFMVFFRGIVSDPPTEKDFIRTINRL